jgi:hypothetical protein
MTSLTSSHRLIRPRSLVGVVAAGAVAVGMLTGPAVAFAQPDTGSGSTRTTEPAEPQAASANADVLASVYEEYATGAGGGQVSNWIKEAMQLRAQGFRPNKSNIDAIENSLKYRPNQTPLIEALKETVAYQRKLQAQAQNAVAPNQGGFAIGPQPGQTPVPGQPGYNDHGPGIDTGPLFPGTGVQQPLG